MYLGSWKLDDLLTFAIVTTRVDTGAATDADSAPSYRVYEDETATPILTGTMALLDSGNTAGFYSEQITLSAANGFEAGKSYNIYIQATVNSIVGATVRNFQMRAEVNANVTQWLGTAAATPTVGGVPEVDVTHWLGTAAATPTVAGVPEVDMTHLVGVAQSAADLKDFADDGYDPATNKVQGVVLVDTTTTVTNAVTANTTLIEGVDATNQIRDAVLNDATRFAGADVAAIKAKTDNLPIDPADQSLIIAATNAIIALLGTPAGASVSADIAALKAVADAVKAKTDQLTFTIANKVDSSIQAAGDFAQAAADKVWLSAARTLTSFGTLVADVAAAVWGAGTRTLTSFGTLTADVADKLLGRNLAGGSDGGRTVKDALRVLRNKRSIAAGTLTVTQEDDATPAWTATVTTAVSDPIDSVDPA